MPDDEKDEAEKEPQGTEPTGTCAACGMQNEADAKFCDQCGESMAAKKIEDEEADDDKEPPSSKPKPGEAKAMIAPKRMTMEASVASILGASSESVPAVKTRAIDLRQVFDAAVGVFGSDQPKVIVGALLSVPDLQRKATELAETKRKAEKAERWSLAHRLNKLGLAGRSRGSIFVDELGKDGKRTSVGLQPEYARMDLEVFKGLVEGLERTAGAYAKHDPFRPDAEAAKQAAADHAASNGLGKAAPQLVNGAPTKAQIETAKSAPAVLAQFNRPGNTFALEAIAEEHVRTCAAIGQPIRGAA